MIRTLIFGAIAGYVGKKLYDEGKLTEFKDDLVSRYNQARNDISARTNSTSFGTASSTTGLGASSNSSTPPIPRSSAVTGQTASPSIS